MKQQTISMNQVSQAGLLQVEALQIELGNVFLEGRDEFSFQGSYEFQIQTAAKIDYGVKIDFSFIEFSEDEVGELKSFVLKFDVFLTE